MGFLSNIFGGYQAQSAPIQTVAGLPQQIQAAGNTANNQAVSSSNFSQALQGLNGIGNEQSVFGQQQALANQLQAQANGQGPNLAANQLQQGTNQSIQQAAALGASQGGVNPGLAQRNILEQQAATNQGAASNAAATRMQGQLAAQQQLAGQQANLAGLASNQVGQQASGIQNAFGNALALQNQYANQLAQQNQEQLTNTGNINSTNAGVAGANAGNSGSILKGVGNAASGVLGLGLAYGGEAPTLNAKAGGHVPGDPKVSGDDEKNDTVHAMLSPGEVVLPRTVALASDAPEKAKAFVEALKQRSPGFQRAKKVKERMDRE